ncbi:hypothetical protein [Tatumella sp. OPLPL6]|uniref:hypothetical protein n=1 Tax=Tatumella sp. OPLPL6 TaxID=1928657 RepID=UPI000C195678|nr:hypothetical protein [Tatumella sp. OPLPL6]PIJ42672.1 hypothetical protein BOM24_11305 [Tatumella sp. OPLPL6]
MKITEEALNEAIDGKRELGEIGLRFALKELRGLRQKTTWLPLEDKQPEDDTLCLAADVTGVIWTCHYESGELTPDTGGEVDFTHWMPLPELP